MTEQIHCHDCRHWETEAESDRLPNPVRDLGLRACRRMQSSYGEPADSDTLAYAIDAEALSADVVTGPGYSCIMAEPIV